MSEYMKREDAIATIMSEPPDAHYPHWYADKIKSIPAADVTPVRHGRWKEISDNYEICATEFECSNCKESFCTSELSDKEFRKMMKYCPNCGATMDGGDGNSDNV